MPPTTLVKIVLATWFIAEALVFVLLVRFVGLGWVALAGFLTSVLGFAVLKRAGAAAVAKLRASFQGPRTARGFDVVDDGLSALGAIALLLPGFLSDLIGLALLVRPVRERVIPRIAVWLKVGRASSRRHDPQPSRRVNVVDLDPEEWRRTEQRRSPEIR